MSDPTVAEQAEQACWLRAVEIYNTTLTKDPRKKISLKPSEGFSSALHGDGGGGASRGAVPITPCGIDDLIKMARETLAQSQRTTAQGHWRRRIEQLLEVLQSFCGVVDIIMEHQPPATALVWGGIRFLLQIAVTAQETSSELFDSLDTVMRHLQSYRRLCALFHSEDGVRESVSRIYALILCYVIRATAYFSHSYWDRFRLVVCRQTKAKMKKTLEWLRNEAANLDREVVTVSETLHCSERQRTTNELLKDAEYRAEMRNFLQDRRRAGTLNAFQKWLQNWLGSDYEGPLSAPGTCRWILQDPTFQEWTEQGYPDCLYIYGIPGCGKSVLATFLARAVGGSDDVVEYHFQNHGDHRQRPAMTFAATLLSEILYIDSVMQSPFLEPVLEDLQNLQRSYKASRTCKLDPLLKVLDNILRDIPKLVLVVDALDECGNVDEQSTSLIEWLLTTGERPNISVILLSRNHTCIDEIINTRHRIHMSREIVDCDVQIFLRQQIPERGLDLLKSEILRRAALDCQGMFQWAKLLINHVEQGQTNRDRRRNIYHFPVGLFDAYERLLEDSTRHLTTEQINCRYDIFRLVIGAQKALATQEIADALALSPDKDMIEDEDRLILPEEVIARVCYPFATVVHHRVNLIHSTVKEFLLQLERAGASSYKDQLCLNLDDCNQYLACKTLTALTRLQYRLWKYPAGLLRKHLLGGDTIAGVPDEDEDGNGFYDYASLHWQDHLTALVAPPETVLVLFKGFLRGNEFVSWSERLFDLKRKSSVSAQVGVKATLQLWYDKKLQPELRPQVPLEDYFIISHESLTQELFKVGEDKLLPYLPLLRLGNFYNVGGNSIEQFRAAYHCKKTVAEGFENILGKRNPLTLRARTSLYQEYFWQSRMDEAEEGLQEVALIQLEVIGIGNPDYYRTLYFLGLSQFYLTKSEAALSNLKDSVEGLRELVGNVFDTFSADLFYGYALEACGHLEPAIARYENIWTQWTLITSDKHPLSLMTQTAKGSAYRKQKRFTEAETALERSWQARQHLFSLNSNTTADSGIQLAVLYRDTWRDAETASLLDQVAQSSIFPADFQRRCQITHLHALLGFDAGEYEPPKASLLLLLDEATGAQRDRNNRELLWVRITLADEMRAHGEVDLALMIFTDLVKPVETPNGLPSELEAEPESPHQLRTAEQALRYIKAGNQQAADYLLQEHKLQWVRTKDFWIAQGGPVTDTAYMRPS